MTAPVYLSINEFPGDGVTTQFEFNFAGGYISRDHVKAYTTNALGVITPVVITAGMWVNDYTLDLGVSAPVGGTVRIYRDTPRSEPLVNFEDGARITEANLDLLARQTVLAVAEAFDAGAYATVNDLLGAAGAALAAAQQAEANAADSETAAGLSAVAASAARIAAETARDLAQAAQAAAETARDDPAVQTIYTNIADINTVAANIAAVLTVVGVSADVTAVAALGADVVTVAGIQAAVSTVAANIANINAAVAELPALAAKVNKAGDRMTGDLTVPRLNGGQLAGMRNKIINGKMELAQRGTIFGASTLNGIYTLDRWVVGNETPATLTVSRQLGGADLLNSARIVVVTPDSSIAAGDNAVFQQNIEGFNAYDLVGKTFTISFWVRSSVTGTYAIALRNSDFDRSYVANYTINASDTWEYKTVTVAGGLPASGGTWNFTNGVGLRVAWVLACGSSFQTSAGAWQAGNFLATSAQVNFLATASNTLQLTGVQLEVGDAATPFEHRLYGAELALCQRYFSSVEQLGVEGGVLAGFQFPQPMRAVPTVAVSVGTVLGSSNTAFHVFHTARVGLSYTASAEL